MTERATPDTATSYIYADADSKFHEKIIADFLGNKWLGISDDTSKESYRQILSRAGQVRLRFIS